MIAADCSLAYLVKAARLSVCRFSNICSCAFWSSSIEGHLHFLQPAGHLHVLILIGGEAEMVATWSLQPLVQLSKSKMAVRNKRSHSAFGSCARRLSL